MNNKEKKLKAYEWGQLGEQYAAELLLKAGYTIRERNWKNGRYELDLVAQLGDMIVFVEVKTRGRKGDDPLDSVTPDKVKRTIAAANAYLTMMDYAYSYRFDLVSIVGTPDDYEIEHIPDAFLPPLRSYR